MSPAEPGGGLPRGITRCAVRRRAGLGRRSSRARRRGGGRRCRCGARPRPRSASRRRPGPAAAPAPPRSAIPCGCRRAAAARPLPWVDSATAPGIGQGCRHHGMGWCCPHHAGSPASPTASGSGRPLVPNSEHCLPGPGYLCTGLYAVSTSGIMPTQGLSFVSESLPSLAQADDHRAKAVLRAVRHLTCKLSHAADRRTAVASS